jgi:hypothetical protein
MFLMRADTLRGQVGVGWALEIESFLGPVILRFLPYFLPVFASSTKMFKMVNYTF